MALAKEYQANIDSLGIDGMQLTAKDVGQAKAQISQIRSYQRELRQVKKSLNMEIKGIRADYRDRISNAGSVTGGVFSLFGKRGIAGSLRASAKRNMTRQRDSELSPFEDLKLYVDELMHQLDNAKYQFEGYITENKVVPASTSGARFCHECGKKVAKTHKFCAHCGAKVSS